ncbi:MAG: B12-binding domain-containing radical SAM protein [Theionarchaea archaeon]|nr:B12-binding domain-containing radical SAM protein [Theionarchaea archaeon]MBU7001930.1 B12-binding domain-containing radical SAM protein [Theionarchaea archaeon]MBU7020417.1 B12-binding domain-containing radical SAM protein [Theionarchaea archaeon]MBU7041640.1 B12-binding domain-containing radical SAM protein [Theionarchaea archaeon]
MTDITLMNSVIGAGRGQLGIGLLYIAASLEEAGYSVEFTDYQNEDVKRKADPEVLSHFMESSAPVLGISVFCNALPSVLKAVSLLKESHDVTVILGGPAASVSTERLLELSAVDIAVVGEGERTIVEIMEALDRGDSLSSVNGICYRDNGNIVTTPERQRIVDLDSVPFPAYHHIDFGEYRKEANVITARGCPFQCTFCVKSIWKSRKTLRSVENVIDELLQIEDKIDRINLSDDTFVLEKERVVEFCESLKKEGIDKNWSCTGRVGMLPDSLMESMSHAGCDTLFLGIESGSSSILKKIRKEFKPEEARQDIVRANQHFDRVYTSYMWGFPGESLDDFYDTVMFQMEDVQMSGVQPVMTLVTPFQSTTLYSEYSHTLKFMLDNTYNGSTLPPPERLRGYPELEDLVRRNPDVFSSFYYYENEGFEEKCKMIDKIREREKKEGSS